MDRGSELSRKELSKKYTVFVSWLVLSLIVTIYSKWLMVNYFPYPITLSLVHMTTVSILTYVISLYKTEREIEIIEVNAKGVDKRWRNSIKDNTSYGIKYSENKGILIFSLLVAINIWLSNSSLLIASISLHQVARTTIPLFTMVLGVLFFKHKYHLVQLPSVVLVIIGVAITVNSTPELSIYGVLVVFLSCCASSLKGIVAQKIQVENNNKIGSIKMLMYIGPIASLTLLVLSISFGEASKIMKLIEKITYSSGDNNESVTILSLLLATSGILAFALNVLSLKSSSIVTPLAMNIAGNVKQLITCILGCFIFGNPFTDKLAVGIILTSIGAIWYSMGKKNEVNMKKVRYYKGRYIDRIGVDSKEDISNSNYKKNENSGASIEQISNINVKNYIPSNDDKQLGRESIETECVDMEISYTKSSHGSQEVEFEGCYYEDEARNENFIDTVDEENEAKGVRIIDLYIEDDRNSENNDKIIIENLQVEIGSKQVDQIFILEEKTNCNNSMVEFTEYPEIGNELDEIEIQVEKLKIDSEENDINDENLKYKGAFESLENSLNSIKYSSQPYMKENICINSKQY
ncbi:hypothetical protein FG379_000087 [Cryptosporidium bovis]|uniref:uncharacterized protein n=1 Tax=Cryptosporidium bovis TaxID=310047 RepID=UPI00351A68EC|nr:hypothetical protein FG379_000087 [Cryptosporidium bovis]